MDTKEIARYVQQIDKLHKEGSYEDVRSLLADLNSSFVSLEQLQTTDIARTVFQILKSCPVSNVRTAAKGLLSKWKHLYSSTHTRKTVKDSQTNEHEPPAMCKTGIAGIVSSDQQQMDGKVNESEDVLCQTLEQYVEQSSGPYSNQLSSEKATVSKEMTTVKSADSKPVASPPENHSEERSVLPPHPCSSTESTALRSKCVELLLQALNPAQKTDLKDTCHPSTVAEAIERHIHALHFQNQAKYKTCIRSKVANLKNSKNPHLRLGLLTGALAPEVFAQMSTEEMAGEELRKLREGYTVAAISEHQLPQRLEGTTTTKVRCQRCQGMNCRVTQVPRGTLFLPSWVRSGNADEDAMTFMTCVGCGEQWYHSSWVCL
ncbi:transcription elongation factor A N-terminal and central domain-containing protein [Hoplias malabaricus]|uniref:transcription elongation factor A N-terminal and central domain-containing protein n=1 Tax=Hoplias malabaricus TaxID=27720 RepID=UPI0034630D74